MSESLIRSTKILSEDKYFLDRSFTHGGMVAEKRRFCVFLGEFFEIKEKIFSMSGWKPCFIISSASSRHVASSLDRQIAPLSSKSISLPGVATIMSTPYRSFLIC